MMFKHFGFKGCTYGSPTGSDRKVARTCLQPWDGPWDDGWKAPACVGHMGATKLYNEGRRPMTLGQRSRGFQANSNTWIARVGRRSAQTMKLQACAAAVELRHLASPFDLEVPRLQVRRHAPTARHCCQLSGLLAAVAGAERGAADENPESAL